MESYSLYYITQRWWAQRYCAPMLSYSLENRQHLPYEPNMFVCVCDSVIYSLRVCIFASCMPTDGSIVFTLKYDNNPLGPFFTFSYSSNFLKHSFNYLKTLSRNFFFKNDLLYLLELYRHCNCFFCLLTLWSAQMLSILILKCYFWPS